MANDICIIKVLLNDCDFPALNPIRVIMDEITAIQGFGLFEISKQIITIKSNFD